MNKILLIILGLIPSLTFASTDAANLDLTSHWSGYLAVTLKQKLSLELNQVLLVRFYSLFIFLSKGPCSVLRVIFSSLISTSRVAKQ